MRALRLTCFAFAALVLAAIIWTTFPGIPVIAAERFIVIGCVSRDAQRNIVLTDTRTEPPTVYRLNGSDETTLTFHIGHTLEIAGQIIQGPPKAISIEQLTYISPNCVKLKPTQP
jgi:hypothetical protein